MADKAGGRWQEAVRSSEGGLSGVQLTVTRKGVEVFGWYDTFVGCGETLVLSWDEFDAMRRRVMAGVPHVEGGPT